MQNPVDEFIIPSGKYKGRPVDTKTRRTFELAFETKNYYIVDYFFHNSKYYRAKIPKNSVSNIYGQRFNFSTSEKDKKLPFFKRLTKIRNPFMNHVQVRFSFEKENPIMLYPLGAKVESDASEFTLYNLVYSIEVVGPKGESWSVFRSFGDFITAHRMLSLDEVVFERITLGQYIVLQSPPLMLKENKKNRALESVIRRGNAAGMKENYYLITFKLGAVNCTSETFKILDSLMFDEYNFFQKWISRFLWRLPLSSLKYLKLRGVIDSNMSMPTLNEEFSEFANSVELKNRLKK